MRRKPVRLHLNLSVELLIAAELAKQSLAHTCCNQSDTMFEHDMSKLMRNNHRQPIII